MFSIDIKSLQNRLLKGLLCAHYQHRSFKAPFLQWPLTVLMKQTWLVVCAFEQSQMSQMSMMSSLFQFLFDFKIGYPFKLSLTLHQLLSNHKFFSGNYFGDKREKISYIGNSINSINIFCKINQRKLELCKFNQRKLELCKFNQCKQLSINESCLIKVVP